MKKFLIVLFAVTTLFISCKNNPGEGNKSKVSTDEKLIIAFNSASRMMTPDCDWGIDPDYEWTIILQDSEEKLSPITYENVKVNSSNEVELTIPVGTYDITVECEVENAGSSYSIFGSEENVEIEEGEVNTVSIILSLKKQGTGTFEYTLGLNKALFAESWYGVTPEIADNKLTIFDYCIEAYLQKISDSEKVNLSLSCEKTTTLSADDETLEIKFSADSVASGYYYLIIKYNEDDESIITITPDNVVEIADNLSTTDNAEITIFKNEKIKNIYVANDTDADSANYNGLTPAKRKGLNAAMEWLQENPASWDKANLYFANSEDPEDYPIIDIDNNPTTDGDEKVVELSWVTGSNTSKFEFRNGKCYLTSNYYNNFELTTSALSKDYEIIYRPTESDSELTLSQLSLDKVNLTISDVKAVSNANVIAAPGEATAYTATSKDFLTIEYLTDKRFDVELAGEYEGYIILPQPSTNGIVHYYTAEAGQENITIERLIPRFEIGPEVTSYFYGDENHEFTATPVTDGEEFKAGTTFKWTLNGTVLSETENATVTINFATNSSVKLGVNILVCEAKYDDEYYSSTISFQITKPQNTG